MSFKDAFQVFEIINVCSLYDGENAAWQLLSYFFATPYAYNERTNTRTPDELEIEETWKASARLNANTSDGANEQLYLRLFIYLRQESRWSLALAFSLAEAQHVQHMRLCVIFFFFWLETEHFSTKKNLHVVETTIIR